MFHFFPVKTISIKFNVNNSKYGLSILNIYEIMFLKNYYNDNFKKYIQINKLCLAGLLERSNV